jgi:hypothetical protein
MGCHEYVQSCNVDLEPASGEAAREWTVTVVGEMCELVRRALRSMSILSDCPSRFLIFFDFFRFHPSGFEFGPCPERFVMEVDSRPGLVVVMVLWMVLWM